MSHKCFYSRPVVFGREIMPVEELLGDGAESAFLDPSSSSPSVEQEEVGELDLGDPDAGAPIAKWGRRDAP